MSQKHSYVGAGPRDAQLREPIDGSRLYSEGEGRIKTLFPLDQFVNTQNRLPISYYSPGAGLDNIVPGVNTFKLQGTSFVTFQNTLLSQTEFAYIKFRKNNIDVSDWLPLFFFLNYTINFLRPTSPVAADATIPVNQIDAPSVIPPFLPRYVLEFDEIIVQSNAAFALNAYITSGKTSIAAL